jgi:integrase
MYVDEVDRRDLIKFAAFLRDEKEQAPQTCSNKFRYVVQFLKSSGIQTSGKGGLLQKGDWPSFTEEEPEIYEQEDLDALFAACDDEERLLYQFFLMTGMRDQEVMHAYWSDVIFAAKTVRVTHKPDRSWTPKAYKEREIPVPDVLIDSLKAWKKQSNKGCNLVFPTAGCKPDTHFLERLKTIAERAGLDREKFWLHKFRATFATRHLWNGVDLRTVQNWMGHTDLASTMRYLKPNRGEAVRTAVNSSFA